MQTHFPLNIKKRSVRHYGSTSIWFRPRDTLVDSGLGWAGLGWAGLGWAGLGWAGLGWAGLGWAGLGWAGQLWNLYGAGIFS